MPNPFTYVQLHSRDAASSKSFFGSLFDWAFQDLPSSAPVPYTEILVGEGTGGGIMAAPAPDTASHWVPFIAVDDVDEYARRAVSLGAVVMLGPTDVPAKGRFAILRDPTEAPFALWRPLPSRGNGAGGP